MKDITMKARSISRRDFLRMIEGATALSVGAGIAGCVPSSSDSDAASSSEDLAEGSTGSSAAVTEEETAVDYADNVSLSDVSVWQMDRTDKYGTERDLAGYVLSCMATNSNDVTCLVSLDITGTVAYEDNYGDEATLDITLGYSVDPLYVGANSTEQRYLVIVSAYDGDDFVFGSEDVDLETVNVEVGEVRDFADSFGDDYEYISQDDLEFNITSEEVDNSLEVTIEVTNNTEDKWEYADFAFIGIREDGRPAEDEAESIVRIKGSESYIKPGGTLSFCRTFASLELISMDEPVSYQLEYFYYKIDTGDDE